MNKITDEIIKKYIKEHLSIKVNVNTPDWPEEREGFSVRVGLYLDNEYISDDYSSVSI